MLQTLKHRWLRIAVHASAGDEGGRTDAAAAGPTPQGVVAKAASEREKKERATREEKEAREAAEAAAKREAEEKSRRRHEAEKAKARHSCWLAPPRGCAAAEEAMQMHRAGGAA